jgi:hypothetical protein
VYILIDANGQLSIEDSDNLRAFSIVEAETGLAATHLEAIATPAGDAHYWIDAGAVIALSGRRDDERWVNNFWNMLAQVEAYGYSDLANKRVKAHVDQA